MALAVARHAAVRESVTNLRGEQMRVWQWVGADVLAHEYGLTKTKKKTFTSDEDDEEENHSNKTDGSHYYNKAALNQQGTPTQSSMRLYPRF